MNVAGGGASELSSFSSASTAGAISGDDDITTREGNAGGGMVSVSSLSRFSAVRAILTDPGDDGGSLSSTISISLLSSSGGKSRGKQSADGEEPTS